MGGPLLDLFGAFKSFDEGGGILVPRELRAGDEIRGSRDETIVVEVLREPSLVGLG